MADNYLERKMEEHRSGRPAAKHKSPSFATQRKGYISVKFPPRRVFITGGAVGIGREIVRAFRAADCQVAFCDIDLKQGTATSQETGARFYHVDVSDTTALAVAFNDLIKHWGDVDIIVNNVGVCEFKPISETSLDDFDGKMAVNLRPVFLLAKLLRTHRDSLAVPNEFGGRIINIASSRHLMSEKGTSGYSASKGAITSLTHSLMMDFADLHITVNSISPGWIQTADYDSLTPEDHSQHPSGRVGKPDDIARACIFLSMPDNDFINGIDLIIDGGMTHKMIYV